jgi:phosphohistidine phosphatase SixA
MSHYRLSQATGRVFGAIALLTLMCVSAPSKSQITDSTALLSQLQKGGQVIVMRHASSPRAEPDKTAANPDNTGLERQLDDTGRTTATAMGKALRELHIPVRTVLSSPTYRALETIKLAQLPTPQIHPELGDGGQSMQSVSAAQAAWLQKQVKLHPKGSNTLIVTHLPNLSAAFPQHATGLTDGEALIFGSDGKGDTVLLARMKIEEWPKLAK